jgi:hypothetical protein
MVPGPFERKPMPGDFFRLPAEAVGAMLDAARAHRLGQGLGSERPPPEHDDASVILIQNDTGSALQANQVVGLNNPIFQPVGDERLQTFRQIIGMQGVIPSVPDHTGLFAVTLEPIPSECIGQAVVSGPVAVMIDVQDADDQWADVAGGITGHLTSGPSGSAQILWKQAGTGPLWAIVRLGAGLGAHKLLSASHPDTLATESDQPAVGDLVRGVLNGDARLWARLARGSARQALRVTADGSDIEWGMAGGLPGSGSGITWGLYWIDVTQAGSITLLEEDCSDGRAMILLPPWSETGPPSTFSEDGYSSGGGAESWIWHGHQQEKVEHTLWSGGAGQGTIDRLIIAATTSYLRFTCDSFDCQHQVMFLLGMTEGGLEAPTHVI